MLRLFNFSVICYEIKNGRNILMWLATWGGSLPGQLRYLCYDTVDLIPGYDVASYNPSQLSMAVKRHRPC